MNTAEKLGVHTLLQVSDTHFGTERPEVVEALMQLVAQSDPELVVMSGDLTQRARDAQFAAARAFMDRLAPRVLVVIPGNHDVPLYNPWLRVVRPYQRYRRWLGDSLEPEHDGHPFLVIGVNSFLHRTIKDGAFSRRQIARVAERLRRARADQLRIVVAHHPIMVVRTEDDENLVGNAEAAAHAWSDAGADIVMGGHIHLPYVRPLRQRYPALSRELWAVQAGTATSSRTRDGIENSVNLLRVRGEASGHDAPPDPMACEVEQWHYSPSLAAFECRSHQRFVPERGHSTCMSPDMNSGARS